MSQRKLLRRRVTQGYLTHLIRAGSNRALCGFEPKKRMYWLAEPGMVDCDKCKIAKDAIEGFDSITSGEK